VIQFLAGIIQSAALEANHSSQKNVNADLDARAVMSIASTCRTHFQVTGKEKKVLFSNDKICLSFCKKVFYSSR